MMENIKQVWRLFFPTTIYGIVRQITTNPFTAGKVEFWHLLHFWIMTVFLVVTTSVLSRSLESPLYFRTLAYFSPFAIGTINENIPTVIALGSILSNWITYRVDADSGAKEMILERMKCNRMKRSSRFDVYMPNTAIDNFPSKSTIKGLILLPGAYVDHSAYSLTAAKLSDRGILVAVMSMEPLRLASPYLGADPSDVRRVMRKASQYALDYKCRRYVEWSIGGHSAGGYAAMTLAHRVKAKKLVIWAAGTIPDLLVDLKQRQIDVLAIFGSKDNFAHLTRKSKKNFLSKMPQSRTVLRIIKGANHAGFGCYNPSPPFSEPKFLCLEKQHEITASITANFLKDRR